MFDHKKLIEWDYNINKKFGNYRVFTDTNKNIGMIT